MRVVVEGGGCLSPAREREREGEREADGKADGPGGHAGGRADVGCWSWVGPGLQRVGLRQRLGWAWVGLKGWMGRCTSRAVLRERELIQKPGNSTRKSAKN